jgi:hypothetical protein
MDADKFHANCYGHSGAVRSIHYLLRQKPYHVMWGGQYVLLDDKLAEFSRKEDLLGISTYINREDFELNDKGWSGKDYYDKVKFIIENSERWNTIKVWEESREYFDWGNTHSVEYSGYLVNHTQKLAVDLADYFEQSRFFSGYREDMTIDAVPVLTETGGGTQMALFNGVAADSTEELAEEWCGDLLQIVDEPMKDYKIINCCFSEIWQRAGYCFRAFGVNDEQYLLKDNSGRLYTAAPLSIRGNREREGALYIETRRETIKFNFAHYDNLPYAK